MQSAGSLCEVWALAPAVRVQEFDEDDDESDEDDDDGGDEDDREEGDPPGWSP